MGKQKGRISIRGKKGVFTRPINAMMCVPERERTRTINPKVFTKLTQSGARTNLDSLHHGVPGERKG